MTCSRCGGPKAFGGVEWYHQGFVTDGHIYLCEQCYSEFKGLMGDFMAHTVREQDWEALSPTITVTDTQTIIDDPTMPWNSLVNGKDKEEDG